MNEQEGKEYYLSRKSEILTQFDTHAKAWRPFLAACYGDEFADAVLRDAREQYEALISEIPYIGGDENPMTRHLVRSTTSLVLYKVMKALGKTAEEVGKVVYDAVVEVVSQLPPCPFKELSAECIAKEKERARKSQERYYPEDWVWEFVEGAGMEFDYGYDFLECGTQKFYHAQDADEFLPFYCYLDLVTHRTTGWGFARSMTLAEGYEKCDFRWKKGGETRKGWPPPFLEEERNQSEGGNSRDTNHISKACNSENILRKCAACRVTCARASESLQRRRSSLWISESGNTARLTSSW